MEPPPAPGLRGLGYRHMLVVILVTYILIIGIPSPALSGPIRLGALGLLLVIALRARRRSGRWTWYALVLTGLLVAVTVAAAISGNERALSVIASGSTVVLVVVVTAVTAQTLMARGVIDGPAVRGVLCVYLLLALLFGALTQFFGAIIPDYLHGASDPPNASESLYFSVITLATVGYGDIVPASALARALAVAEALIGQLYLVSVVAAVVSRFRPKRDRPGGDQPGDDR
jgi:hypothetical protein